MHAEFVCDKVGAPCLMGDDPLSAMLGQALKPVHGVFQRVRHYAPPLIFVITSIALCRCLGARALVAYVWAYGVSTRLPLLATCANYWDISDFHETWGRAIHNFDIFFSLPKSFNNALSNESAN